MTKPPKKKQRPKRNLFRNAAPRPVRALVRQRLPTANENTSAPETKTTWGTETLKTAGGAAGAALACAYIARENWIPPLFVTGLVSAVGGTLAALGKNETLRNVGAGVMAGAGSQALLMLIDHHYDSLETQKRIATAQIEKAAADKAKADHAKVDPTKTTRSAESLPPGALEAAYERARARLAMAQTASQMAA